MMHMMNTLLLGMLAATVEEVRHSPYDDAHDERN
jgi:hypothetical protein